MNLRNSGAKPESNRESLVGNRLAAAALLQALQLMVCLQVQGFVDMTQSHSCVQFPKFRERVKGQLDGFQASLLSWIFLCQMLNDMKRMLGNVVDPI